LQKAGMKEEPITLIEKRGGKVDPSKVTESSIERGGLGADKGGFVGIIIDFLRGEGDS